MTSDRSVSEYSLRREGSASQSTRRLGRPPVFSPQPLDSEPWDASYEDPTFQPSQRQTGAASPQPPAPKKSGSASSARPLLPWLGTWQFWVIFTAIAFGGTSFVAVSSLLRPAVNLNCAAVFWPMASASVRISCAQTAAEKRTVDGFLTAIALVNELPADHPMRSQANELIEGWSQEILKLAEQQFQAGQLKEAIATARKIPPGTSATQSINQTIENWNSIWSKAEELYRQAEDDLKKSNFPQALRNASRLLSVGNTFWENTKYQELTERIRLARETGNKLNQARSLAEQGGLSNLLKAIQLAETLQPQDSLYQESRKLMTEFGRRMLDLARSELDRRDLTAALTVINKIPRSVNLQGEIQDFSELARAESQTWKGNVSDLESAIAQVSRLTPDRPLYGRAQQLISRWRSEIQVVGRLERARQLAAPGRITDLTAAIAELQSVPTSGPRGDEVQQEISRWTQQVQTIEDQPVLDRAIALAQPGDANSLQAAIEQAKQIAKGRALSGEAQGRIQTWTRQIQTMQDQPLLDRARDLASRGSLESAISMAELIQPGRALYSDAQSSIQGWRTQFQSEGKMEEAYRLARSEAPDDLVAAIRVASQVPSSSKLYGEATASINQWSQQILSMARRIASDDVNTAIAIAQKIPSRTEAYAAAQLEIAAWKKRVNLPR